MSESPFAILRREAALKMNEGIRLARDEYREAIAKINRLETELGHKVPVKLKNAVEPFKDIIERHCPRDRAFTVQDLHEIVANLYPDRTFVAATVKISLQRMEKRGEVRRLGRDKGGFTHWAHFECVAEEIPWDTTPVSHVVAEVLAGKSMRPAEIVVAIQALGFRPDESPRRVMQAVSASLARNDRRFVRDGRGKWSLVVQAEC